MRHAPIYRRIAVLAGWNPDADYFFTHRTAKHLAHSWMCGDCEETKGAKSLQKIFAPFVSSWLSFPAQTQTGAGYFNYFPSLTQKRWVLLRRNISPSATMGEATNI